VDPQLAPLLKAALSPMAEVRPHADQIVEALDRYAEGTPVTLAFPASVPAAVAELSPATVPELRGPEPWPPQQGFPEQDWPYQDWPEQHSPDQDVPEESDWQAAWDSEPGQPDPRIGRPSRVGTLLALTVAVLGVAAVWPLVAVGLVVLWSWCARFADRSVTSLVQRRYERGRRRRDVPLAVVVSPWHVVIAACATVIALLLPAVIAVASTFSAALAFAPWSNGDPLPGRSLPLVVGGVIGLLMAWWGPGGASLRRGSRSLIRGVATAKTATDLVVAALLLLGAGLSVWAWQRHGQPNLWPWPAGGHFDLLGWMP
jgi:hypothetical protein